jgi:hypothetical protein
MCIKLFIVENRFAVSLVFWTDGLERFLSLSILNRKKHYYYDYYIMMTLIISPVGNYKKTSKMRVCA